MADTLTAKDDRAKFIPHPEGQFAARCVDVIDLGERVEQYAGFPEKISPKCALLFATGEINPETGEVFIISQEFTVAMGRKANLRQFLEDWRGRSYTDEQADEGVPLHKLEGAAGFITVEHKNSSAGRVYARIRTITPLPKGLSAAEINGYQRAPYWAERKKAYAEDAARFKAKHAPHAAPVEELADFPAALATEDDGLPF